MGFAATATVLSLGAGICTVGACGSGAQNALDAAPPAVDAPVAQGVDCRAAPTVPPAELGLDPFYVKYVDAGIPVIASVRVRDEALGVACEIVVKLLEKRPEIAAKLRENHIRVGVIDTRTELRAADAELARLASEVFVDDAWVPPPY